MRHGCDPRPRQGARISAPVSMLLVGWICGASASAAELFFPNPVYSVGQRPRGIAVGDLDSDGAMDLVVANSDPGVNARVGISILLGTGDGRFGSATSFEAGASPSAVTIGEFNGDGLPDVAIADFLANRVLVLMGIGDGRVGPPRAHPAGLSPAAVLTADFNADGHQDLAVANFDSDDVSILLGGIGGDFAPQMRFAAGPDPRALAGGDFDADGRWDLVVANSSFPGTPAQLSILLGLGDGRFAPGDRVDVGRLPQSVATSDFDGDGRLDIAAVNELDETVSVLIGHGDGTFEPQSVLATIEDPEQLSVGDMNGDGRPDLVVGGANSRRLSVHPGIGDGSFGPEKRFNVGAVHALALARFDPDDRLDVVVAGRASDVTILMGLGGGDLGPIHRSGVGREPLNIVMDDFNRDGILDTASANSGSDDISVLIGREGGGFSVENRFATGRTPWAIESGELNGDGVPDLVIANLSSEDLAVHLGLGDGTFGPPTRVGQHLSPWTIAIDDYDGDGRQDVAVATTEDDLLIFPGTGTGSFQDGFRVPVPDPVASIASADLNGDRRPDLVVAHSGSDTISVLLSLPGGAFQTAVPYDVGSYPVSVEAHDLGGDGRLDLFVANKFSNTLSFLKGRGDGTFEAQVRYPTEGEEPSSIAFGDFNADGSQDVAVANSYSEDVSVFVAMHDTLGLQGRYFASCAPTAVSGGEVTGDDVDDLVLPSPCTDELAILPGRAAPRNRPPVASAGPDVEASCVSGSLLLDASGSADPDSTPGSNDDIAFFRWFESVEAGGELALGTGAVVEAELSCANRRPTASQRRGPSLPAGRHEITLEVTDTTGLVSRDTLTVMVMRPGEFRRVDPGSTGGTSRWKASSRATP